MSAPPGRSEAFSSTGRPADIRVSKAGGRTTPTSKREARTLADVADVPDEMTLRRLLAMLSTGESGGADAAA